MRVGRLLAVCLVRGTHPYRTVEGRTMGSAPTNGQPQGLSEGLNGCRGALPRSETPKPDPSSQVKH